LSFSFVGLISLAVTLVGFWLMGQILIRIITHAAKRAGVSHGEIRLITDWIWLLVIILAIGGVVSITGLASEFTTLTLSGIAALAFSLALQSTLSNIISGILLLLDNTLRVDDIIEYSSIKGVVVKIGLRSTFVRTETGNLVVISNNSIVNGPLTNYSAAERLGKKI
jgi:small conductance mechanosensitive channel